MSSIELYECTECGYTKTLAERRYYANVPALLPCPQCRHYGETLKHVESIKPTTTGAK